MVAVPPAGSVPDIGVTTTFFSRPGGSETVQLTGPPDEVSVIVPEFGGSTSSVAGVTVSVPAPGLDPVALALAVAGADATTDAAADDEARSDERAATALGSGGRPAAGGRALAVAIALALPETRRDRAEGSGGFRGDVGSLFTSRAFIGYVLCHVLAMSAFLLLRKDRPNWPRPVKVSAPWVALAGILMLYYIVILVVGAGAPKLNGYGTWTDFAIGVGILVGSVLLFFYRRIVEDKEPIHWNEATPTMPEGADRDAEEHGQVAAPVVEEIAEQQTEWRHVVSPPAC